ncbi:mitogen-activated protein kinase kinase kinase 7 isoform X2 [Patella vulgata]|uniref:mitogen-activated protein kinase kinase kinase 7 isoform X2 n=1 Tax=Patella vulgata TaxID=6465 RepID=UPI00217FC1CD|nr:mitogen-activated protein kinase kinase kinase 7 isoform X2 [Patella vulgata]
MDSPQTFVEEINITEIDFKEVVGKGAFGVVSRGIWRDKLVAVKNIETESERKAFLTELKQLSRVSHPNIVKLYGACTKHPVCLVMEYAEGGSLYNVLHGTQFQPEYTAAHAMSWALQCARGVEYLHGMSPKALIHRDLKPPNLLLIMGGTVLKICDFGTACDIQTHMTNNKGSAAWMAPEVFEGSNYSEKCDVFSWGIILWEVITRRKPFDEIGGPAFRIMWAVHQGKRPPLIRNLPKPLELLMTRCWSGNPVERPSMAEVVRIMHHLFQFFHGDDKPLVYEDPDYYDQSEYNYRSTGSNISQYGTTVSASPPGTVSQQLIDSHGGTIKNTVPQGIPVHVAYQPNRSAPIVVEEERVPVPGQQSAPASLAASLESLSSPQSSRAETPVQAEATHKRRSADFTNFNDNNLNLQKPGNHQRVFGHRRSGSHGTPYVFLPTTVPEQPTALALNRYPSCETLLLPQPQASSNTRGYTHKRIGSDETNRVSIPSFGGGIGGGGGPVHQVRTYPSNLNQAGNTRQSPARSVSHQPQTSDHGGVNNSSGHRPIHIQTSPQPVKAGGEANGQVFSNMMSMVYLSLDNPLQPLAPFPENVESMAIYDEHCNLMQEYLRERTEMALLIQRKHELTKQFEREERLNQQSSGRVANEYARLSTENESLVTAHRELTREVTNLRQQKRTAVH